MADVVAACGLEGMGERVAVVEDRSPVALALVGCDHRGLDAHAGGDLLVELQLVEVGALGIEEVVLRQLTHATSALARRQCGERVDVAQHCRRLPERADEVLALGQVHPGLAPDRGVDHPEDGRRHVHDRHPAVVHRRGETRHVCDHSTPDSDHDVGSVEAPSGPCAAQRFDGRQRLVLFTCRDGELLVLDPGIDSETDAGLRHHRGTLGG